MSKRGKEKETTNRARVLADTEDCNSAVIRRHSMWRGKEHGPRVRNNKEHFAHFCTQLNSGVEPIISLTLLVYSGCCYTFTKVEGPRSLAPHPGSRCDNQQKPFQKTGGSVGEKPFKAWSINRWYGRSPRGSERKGTNPETPVRITSILRLPCGRLHEEDRGAYSGSALLRLCLMSKDSK